MHPHIRIRVWRWHFFAGLMVIPFAIVLSLTGAIYLFKAQYENYVDSSLANTSVKSLGDRKFLSYEEIIVRFNAQVPKAIFKKLFLSNANPSLFKLEVDVEGESYVYWLDRSSGEILHGVNANDRLMNFSKTLHGELLSGSIGSIIVEFMAVWMIVLILTGMYLWVSNQSSKASIVTKLKAVFLVSVAKNNKRETWKRLHGVLGIWIGLLVLLLLISGLPWTQVWGGAFKEVQKVMGWDGPGQEWFVSLKSKPGVAAKSIEDGLDLWSVSSSDQSQVVLKSNLNHSGLSEITIDQVINKVDSLNLRDPIWVLPPKGDDGVWSVRSMTQYRPDRKTYHFDKWTGEEIMKIEFADYHPVKRVASYGIALHEGALFGVANQLLGLITAISIIFLSVSGIFIWWIRRPKGTFAAPKNSSQKKLGYGWCASIMILSLVLPLFGLSVLCLIAYELICNRLRLIIGKPENVTVD